MLLKIMKFMRDEEGATAVEYGLIVGLIAVAIVGVLLTVGTGLNSLFGVVNTKVGSAAAAAG